MLSRWITEPGRINGIAETLEVTKPKANTKNDVLIKLKPPARSQFLNPAQRPNIKSKLRRIKVRSHGLDYGDQFNRSTLLAFHRGGFFGRFRHSQNHLSGKAVFMRQGRCNGPDWVIMAVWSDSILGTKIKPRKLCEAGSPNIIHGSSG
jgi:hypothetical protein